MPLQQRSARCEQAEYRRIWPITTMMTSANEWKLKSRPLRLNKKPWIAFNKCAHLLTNRNNNDTGSNHNEEEHNDDEQPKTEKSKESSSIDAEVLKGIQAQIASLAQRDELKKAGMTRP